MIVWLLPLPPSPSLPLPPSLSLSRSLTVPLFPSLLFPNLNIPPAWELSPAERCAGLLIFPFFFLVGRLLCAALLLGCAVPCRAVPCGERDSSPTVRTLSTVFFPPTSNFIPGYFQDDRRKGCSACKAGRCLKTSLLLLLRAPEVSGSGAPAASCRVRFSAQTRRRVRETEAPGIRKRRDPVVMFPTIRWGSSWCVCVCVCVCVLSHAWTRNATSEARHLKTLGALRVDM